MNARIRKKVAKRPWVSGPPTFDEYVHEGLRRVPESRFRYVRDLGPKSEKFPRKWRRRGRGRFQTAFCRLVETDWSDPIMEASGCSGEFANDFRKKDMRDGCPLCLGQVAENASEPDVMAGWEL